MITRDKRKAQAGSQCLSFRYSSKSRKVIRESSQKREQFKTFTIRGGTPRPSIGTFLQDFFYPNSFLLQFNPVCMKRM